MAKNDQKPAIRFQGFTDAWEQRKLGHVFVEYSEKGHPELPALTIIQGGGTVRRDESERSLQYDKASLVNYKMVNAEDFIVHLRSFEGGLEKATTLGIISPAYHTFHGEGTDSRFYYSYFRSKRFIEQDLKPHVYGIRDGRSIDIEGMKTIEIPWTSYTEQQVIGNYIDTMDNLITLHQRKYDKLLSIKKSMLEKIFPRDGSKFPEIRFSGFTNPWEQRKVTDMFKITRGYVLAAPLTSEQKSDEMPYPVYSSQTKDQGLMGYYKEYLYEDAITWTTDGANAGTVNYRAGKFYCTNVCGVLLVDKVVPNQMIAEALNNVAKGHVSYVGNPKLMNNVMAEIEISLPSSAEERDRITEFFSEVDDLITLHQRKLEKLKNIKKSMLEKMFV